MPATFVQRSDGEFYPFALQSVSAGSAIGLANSGGGPAAYIDLSRSWLGEPGPSYGDDELTPRELAELDQVMAEVEAEEAAAAYSALEGFSETFDRNCAAEAARDQARAAADLRNLISPPRNDEDIVARALAELEDEIYDTSRAAGFASPSREAIDLSTELTMATGEGICGIPDPFGRCGNRYHDLRCRHAINVDWQASEPPRSTYATALSNFDAGHDLGPVPASYGDGDDSHPIPQGTLDLAHALNQSWGLSAPDTLTADDLFAPSWAGDPYAAMARELGRDDLAGEQPQRPDYPDVSAIRAGLGL